MIQCLGNKSDLVELIQQTGQIAYNLNQLVHSIGLRLKSESPELSGQIHIIAARCIILQEQRAEAEAYALRVVQNKIEPGLEFYTLVRSFVNLSTCVSNYLSPTNKWDKETQAELFELLFSYGEGLICQFNSLRGALKNLDRSRLSKSTTIE
jgi:hypothetical protein